MYDPATRNLKIPFSGTWGGLSQVKRLTLDLGLSHDLTFHRFEPHVRTLLGILSSSLSAPIPLMLSLSQNE